MKKKLLGILLSIGLVLTMIPATVFADVEQEDVVTTKTSQDVDVTTEGTSKDVEVDYTYLAESNTAEKVFNVTIDYTLPATLDAKGAQNTYTWDTTNGKYVLDTDSSEEASYTLSNEGAFEIKLTNQSNVNIDYEVSYAANASAVFASALDGSMTNPENTIATVAQGQEVTADGINITNSNNATADKTGEFNTATCSGKLKVTGINFGKTPADSSTDTLGTFTIKISEDVPEAVTTVADIASGVENWSLDMSYDPVIYMRYYNNNLTIVEEKSGTDAKVSIPGTTPVTLSTYTDDIFTNEPAWTCTVGDATYYFLTNDNKIFRIVVSGLSTTNYNGLYAAIAG